MVIADTSVWVQAFRVRASQERREVDRLLAQGEIAMVGVVLAEMLQGTRSRQEFDELSLRLTALPFLSTTKETWLEVGALSYQLRQRGLTLPLVDLVIAALALGHDLEVYTLDQDFQRIPGLRLHQAGEEERQG